MWVPFTSLLLIIAFATVAAGKEYKPESPQDLQDAFDRVNPGDTIQLQPMDYYGDFVVQRTGTKVHPIKIFGTENDDGSAGTGLIGNTTTLFLKGDYYHVKTLNITGIEEGLYMEGSSNSVESMSFYGLKQAIIVEGTHNVFGSISLSDLEDAIFVRGSDNKFRDISCNNATSGIIIEKGDRTKLHNMAIHDSDGKILSLVLNEGTCCGRISNTIYDGLVEVKGSGYNFRQTIVNGAINIFGCGNSFGRSVFGRTYKAECPPESQNKYVTSNIFHFPQDKPTTLQSL